MQLSENKQNVAKNIIKKYLNVDCPYHVEIISVDIVNECIKKSSNATKDLFLECSMSNLDPFETFENK